MTLPGGLAQGLSEFLFHPTIGSVKPLLDYNGPFSGMMEITHFQTRLLGSPASLHVNQSFGVVAQLSGAIPTGWGFTTGWVSADGQLDTSVYSPPICQIVTCHQFPGSYWIPTQSRWVETFPELVFWDITQPGKVGLYVTPHLEVDLFWLLAAIEPYG